jgi:chemotaxis protein methyltransferase CheR
LKEAEKPIPPEYEEPPPLAAMPLEKAVAAELPQAALSLARSFYEQGRYVEVSETLLAGLDSSRAPDPQVFSLLARALANQGRLAEALIWCGRWVAADKLDPSGHYLRAVVLQELGDKGEAGRSLQRALYLQPDFVLAHFALANLARNGGRSAEAEKYFSIALNLLRSKPSNDLLQESDGLTAARLIEIISSVLEMEATP